MVRLSKSPNAAESSLSVIPVVPASASRSIICLWRETFAFKPVWSSSRDSSMSAGSFSTEKHDRLEQLTLKIGVFDRHSLALRLRCGIVCEEANALDLLVREAHPISMRDLDFLDEAFFDELPKTRTEEPSLRPARVHKPLPTRI